ncbi:MAG: amidohydrolase [Gemmataceae bacterium]|nr:amidohydrolase [Gemmataceae bacterium]
MWKRQCEVDSSYLPIPARIISNEEFIPPPPTEEQIRYSGLALQLAESHAKKLGSSRRDFLRTSAGMACALAALNQVYGACYEVRAEELADPAAFKENWPKDQFIFDLQTHHVDVSGKWYDNTPEGNGVKRFLQAVRPSLFGFKHTLEALNRGHYVKEVFGDSDTVMAMISGVPTREWNKNPLPPDQMVETRKFVNDISGSQRVLSHGLIRPNLGLKELDEMERQVKELKVDAWKMYTGAELGEKYWRLDDEKVAYPFWERTKKLGLKNICVHKGLPLGLFNEKGCHPADLEKAALDWPDLNFIVYHSGYQGYSARKPKEPQDPQEIPWVSDILRILKKNPKIKNIYFELGGTFNILSSAAPKTCLHMLGQILLTAGADHVIWGTDSIWNGSPQGQIVRLRRLKMLPELVDKFHYPELTDEIKNQILGLNAARLFNINAKEKRQALSVDKMSRLREEYRLNPSPSNTQFGWVWEDKSKPVIPVGSESPG